MKKTLDDLIVASNCEIKVTNIETDYNDGDTENNDKSWSYLNSENVFVYYTIDNEDVMDVR